MPKRNGNSTSGNYNRPNIDDCVSEISDKLEEMEEFMKFYNQKKKKKGRNKSSLPKKLHIFLGYFCIVKTKLKDEIVFGRDYLRNTGIHIRRLEDDLASKKSALRSQVEVRDKLREEYDIIEQKRNETDKHAVNYPDIHAEYHSLKGKKEEAEGKVNITAMGYKNLDKAIELMGISLEQSEISLEQGEDILKKVENAIKVINSFYSETMRVLQHNNRPLQITGGRRNGKRKR